MQYWDWLTQAAQGNLGRSYFTQIPVAQSIAQRLPVDLSIALLAYELSLNGETPPVIDDLTGVQRVFFGWAQVWRTKSRDAEAIRRLAIDPHSPPEFRCNGVIRNIDAFYDAFDVAENDELYLDPQRRVRIWN